MTTDQKIDEVLKIVREQGGQLLGLIREQGEVLIEERVLNNSRFVQLSTGLMDLRKEVGELSAGLRSLDAKIDKVHESLTADINAFGEDLYETKCRMSRLEKKLLS